MTNNDEENLIYVLLQIAARKLEEAKKAKRTASWKVEEAQANFDEMHQAALDYMQGNGLLETDFFKITTSYRVDVESIDAVPDDYLRVKTITEIDKAKICTNKPAGNWYVLTPNLTVKAKVL